MRLDCCGKRYINYIKKALNGAKILVLGVAYKNDIDDLRDSPALVVIEYLEKEGANVSYYDGYNPSYKGKNNELVYSLKEINPDIVSEYDLVIITTNHSNVDYQMVVDNAKYVFDTKYATKNVRNNNNNIELL